MTWGFRPFYLLFLACVAVLYAGCSTTIAGRSDKAAAAASSSNMQRVEFKTAPFVLTGWQKITQVGAPIHIYIEGDGLAWLARSTPSPNPTPKNPIGLKLAGRDTGPNVIYLARPCQYTPFDTPGNEACSDSAYWRSKRFSQEVVDAYMTALDEIARLHGSTEFYVTGYSGGANIVGLLAARRTDITQLRTVAGNLDNDYFTTFHNVSAMPGSLNMANDAARLAQIPQIHFIGSEDETIPVAIYNSYAAKVGASSCLHYKILADTTHDEGWEAQWPGLLSAAVACQ